MGAHWLHDIGVALEGLAPTYYDGWETRSRSSGGFDEILGICIHHTASDTNPINDMQYMWDSSPDRPVGNIYLSRDGDITVGAAGASNTQGKGGPLETTGGLIPLDAGNKFMIAIEAANNGIGEPWTKPQTDRYVQLVRQLCTHYDLSVDDVFSHFGYVEPSCPGRKLDPAGPSPFGSVNSADTWNIWLFRDAVFGEDPIPVPGPIPTPPVKGRKMYVTVGNSDDPTNGQRYVWDGIHMHAVKDELEYNWYVVLFGVHPDFTLADPFWMTGEQMARYESV